MSKGTVEQHASSPFRETFHTDNGQSEQRSEQKLLTSASGRPRQKGVVTSSDFYSTYGDEHIWGTLLEDTQDQGDML